MKKILTLTTILVFALASTFAKSAQTQLITSIDEIPISYELSYNGSILEDGVEGYNIKADSLTEGGQTEEFTILASSNVNYDQGVTVRVHPHSFKTFLNETNEYDSKIEPQAKVLDNLDIIKAGKHDNILVNRFILEWEGNSELPAGEYISNVYIYYSIK